MSGPSRSTRGREDAIETLIDMDPNGSAFRVSKMNAAISSTLQGRSNRITDGALFDAAHALGKYEITLDSPEVLELYAPEGDSIGNVEEGADNATEKEGSAKSNDGNDIVKDSEKDGDKEGDNSKEVQGKTTTTTLRDGWQTRILRHHDKIIRAKNHANPSSATSTIPQPTTNASGAIPPPALISALRQIFGSVSSPDLQDLLDKAGKTADNEIAMDVKDGDSGNNETAKNTLPSLLHTVLNHNVFKGNSSTLPIPINTDDADEILSPSDRHRHSTGGKRGHVKRDWKSMFEIANDEKSGTSNEEDEGEEGKMGEEEDNDKRAESDRSTIDNADIGNVKAVKSNVQKEEVRVPSPANLESILGNACRDMLQKNGTQNGRVHGLLIAALSVLTGCLYSHEDLENLNMGGANADGSPLLSSSTTTPMDGSDELDTFASLLQVGGLLSALPKGDDAISADFALDEKLLQYFVNASSTYEERIEIQKANLFKSQTPSMTTPKDPPKEKAKPRLSTLSKESSTSSPLPPLDSDGSIGEDAKMSDDSDGDNSSPAIDDVAVSSESTMPALISRPSESSESNNDEEESPDGETDTNRLLQNIVDLVADHVADRQGGNVEDNDSSEEVYDDDSAENNSESEHEIIDREEEEEENDIEESEGDDDDDEDDEEDEDLARALALSLAAAIGADNSDSSNSEEENSQGSDATTEAAAGGRAPALKIDTSSDDTATKTPAPPSNDTKNNASDTAATDDPSTPLPSLPPPPPNSLLPNYVPFFGKPYENEKKDSAEGAKEVAKLNAEEDSSAVFEPSALSSYGQLPASHVLLHLLSAVLGVMQGNESTDDSNSCGSGDFVSRFLSKQASMSNKDTTNTAPSANSFTPDSETVSLLIASLKLSSHLRNAALAELNDLLSDAARKEEEEDAEVNTDEVNQVSNPNPDSTEGLHPEKEDPADIDFDVVYSAFGTETAKAAFETKGLNRKAAAATQSDALQQKTKLKLVELSRRRLSFYSVICHLNLRCLRIFTGKCVQRSSDDTSNAVSISSKTGLALLSLLSNFYSSATSNSFESLKTTMGNFYTECNDIICQEELQNQFLVLSLCNESLYLWGSAISLLYSDHNSRIELLESMLASASSSTVVSGRIETSSWTDNEVQGLKLDILCKRLRVSDMLDCFVASPIVANNTEADHDQKEGLTQPNIVPENSLSIISLLNTAIMEIPGGGNSNLTKLYLALCQRAISNLILWNDLSMSSNDANDHDISGGGDASVQQASGGSSFGSFQLKTNPSKFHFDPTKCADSISVASPGSPAVTANQRATKVWGTVLSTTCFLPKTGVHRWAVKMDKCERGHVFVGVSTARANLKTYVGGDGQGWGLIGTQALWHDRNKLRGDYGATFRTGAVVVVTLDTNVGTLSFGLWKDGTSTSEAVTPGPLSPQAMITSPRRGSAGGGPTIEDWGIAFEGLPLDAKLYPAVGLYQRDDHATLYTVSNTAAQISSIPSSISSGDIYFPSLTKEEDDHHRLSCVRSWNQALCSDGVSFATEILSRSIQLLSSNDASLISKEDTILLTTILPSLASGICLIPSCIPSLSVKYAMELLPLITRCAKLIDQMLPSKDVPLGVDLKEGEWAICVQDDNTESSEEYVIRLKRKDTDDATSYSYYEGASTKNDFSLIGALCGTRVQFIEEHCCGQEEGEVISFEDRANKSTSSFVIDARLSLDGQKFEGIRHSVGGKSERVTGHLKESIADEPHQINSTKQLAQTEYLLCLAVGHLSLMLCSQTALSDIDKDNNNHLVKESLDSMLAASSILSSGILDRDESRVRHAIDSVWERCRAGYLHSDLVTDWQDSIYFELFATADAALSSEDSTKIEDAKSIIEQQSSTTRGSLSRLCPEKYFTAQKAVASAIYYHINGLTQKTPSENASHALKESLWIMENGVRDALIHAEGAIPRKKVCEERCLLFSLIAQFLFEFSCTHGDNLSMQDIFDDVALMFKLIKSEQDLDYVKHQMDVRTEKTIMRFAGLRSLELLLQSEKAEKSEDAMKGIRLHTGMEAALVSLPRLLCPPDTCVSSELDPNSVLMAHLSTIIGGSAASVQACMKSCIMSIFDNIGNTLAMCVDQGSTSLMQTLLATYFTVFDPTEYNMTTLKMLPSLRKIVAHCRDQALLPNIDSGSSSNTRLLDIIRKQDNKRLLFTSVSLLLTLCAQATRKSSDSSSLIDLLSEHLLDEISKSITFVSNESRVISDREATEAVQSDWAIHKSNSKSTDSTDTKNTQSLKGLEYLSYHGTLSMKPKSSQSESPSISYLSHLLSVMHVAVNSQSFIDSIKKRADLLFTSFGFDFNGKEQYTSENGRTLPLSGIPLKLQRRILRVLRPILLSMDANLSITRQFLRMTGNILEVVCDDNFGRNPSLLIGPSALSLLRYLYMFSSSWRDAIHKSIIPYGPIESSTPSFGEMLTFFGGTPGSIHPGSFVMIEPETLSSTKPRTGGALAGAAPITTNTSPGSGAEEIVAGLCRQNSLSGVISSVDPRTGICEVIVLANKSHIQLPPDRGAGDAFLSSSVTIRAVRVSAAKISATDELPLILNNNNLPNVDMFSPLTKTLKSASASIKAVVDTADKELSELEINVNTLMECCLGLRSITVLTSESELLNTFVSNESSSMKLLLAYALQLASLRNKDIHGLSSMPTLEARIWHLLLVRLAVSQRQTKLDNTSPSSLKSLLEEKSSSSDVSPPPIPNKKGGKSKSLRTLPSSAAGLFFGERPSMRSAANNRRGEDANVSASTADQNDEDEGGNDESSGADAALREAAIVQMAELGLPRSWAELALSRVGGTNIEAAVHFCLERGGDMERLLAEESERSSSRGSAALLSSRRRAPRISSSANLIRQLAEMGFPRHWCVEALTATRNNVDDALTWILTNGDRLSAEDEAVQDLQDDEESSQEEDEIEEEEEEGDQNDDDEEDESKEEENIVENDKEQDVESQTLKDEKQESTEQTNGWSGVCPVRFVSGRSNINPKTLEITGLPSGGFSSVGTKGILLTKGKWYYEAEIQTAGCLQIGWADSSFIGHCQADRGDGVGDGPSSWAFDGWRRYRWHSSATEWGCKWSAGDIVGCLVDMDSMTVSFTLNGKGEEIGMGVAFSGEGFRPVSGVYACVSFNRREKLRLILGGKGTEPFKYSPPDGYRGIGEAIHDAIKEREFLLNEEKVLIDPTSSVSNNESSDTNNKRYICDFSDGEHGHELFAWQHRYYGSDASVHLGGGRPGLFGGSSGSLKTSKSNAGSKTSDDPRAADISSRLTRILSKASTSSTPATSDQDDEEGESNTFGSSITILRDAYEKINVEINKELKEVCASLCVLYSQKLVMNTMVSHSTQFSLRSFLPSSSDTPWSSTVESDEQEVGRKLWQVIEHVTSLQSSGWVGEAGAMAVAAEALGLGISVGDNNPKLAPAGMCTVSSSNDQVLLACGGLTQFLTSAISPEGLLDSSGFTSVSSTFSACSENAFGSQVGGSLPFIRTSLQIAATSSPCFRKILLAAVRRSIRLLAVTEYTVDEGASEDDESEESKQPPQSETSSTAPDARLVSFLTGMLLSKPVSERLSNSENIAVRCCLFEAWCIGLLSASSPWRMVCALTSAGILNTCPQALPFAASRIPTIANCLGRLESTVLRRTWAERASVPVCSKYVQSYVELLTGVKRALRLCPDTPIPSFISSMSVQVDAATPLSFTPSCSHEQEDTANNISECNSWECSEGWLVSNTGWEVWTGTVEIMQVEWKVPSRSSVRTLMDGGEGPPLLREGCTVMRGVDWDTNDNDDGKDLYEQDKLDKEKQRRAAEEEEERLAAEQEAKEAAEKVAAEETTETVDPDPTNEVDPSSDPAIDPADDPAIDLNPADDPAIDTNDPVTSNTSSSATEEEKEKKDNKSKKKKKKTIPSKLPLGTVMSIEAWDGVPAMARRVRWHLTGKEGIYPYGGGGGRFDLVHVETNEKETRVKKKHPPPESLEQCASRYGFGKQRISNVILRLRNCPLRNSQCKDEDANCDGILELPDFGAGIRVTCTFYSDGAISITEKDLLYGSKDSGWDQRFGQPNYVSGSTTILTQTQVSANCDSSLSTHDEFLGSSSFLVKNLRNKEQDGGRLRVTSEMRLLRSKQSAVALEPSLSFSSSQPPPICFDPTFHASSISLSKDMRSVTCATSDGRGIAFANVGFTKGVHYWEVKLEKAEIGSVYIGVAEKPGSGPSGSSQGSSLGFGGQPRLNRWLGYGFVNFRATYSSGAERVYGAHCHNGDTVGVLLDCDAGRISYFLDGVKYGEHILSDLGCAFENLSPFGFNADGCGSGGVGQGAPSGVDGARTGRFPANGAVRPKALWPVIGLRHPGDRVTMSSKWLSSQGVDATKVVNNILAVDEVLCVYEERPQQLPATPKLNPEANKLPLPQWFIEESYNEYTRWKSGRWLRSETRGSGPCKLSSYGLDVDLDTSPLACAAASASIGLPIAMLSGDRVDVKRSAGRILELQEEAVILGAYQGRLFYRLVSQKSEGGSLMEGGGRSWFWDESEAVNGGLQLIGNGLGHSVALPKLERFNPCCGGLKVVYKGGAVVRSDLEIFEGSKSLGTIASGTIIPSHEVIERRKNSCGVLRYLVDHAPIGGRGWISSRIRGGKEEPIVEMLPVVSDDNEDGDDCSFGQPSHYVTPEDSAREWYASYLQVVKAASKNTSERDSFSESMNIETVQEFEDLLTSGILSGMTELNSDTLIAATYEKITDALPHRLGRGSSFVDCAIVLSASQPNQQEQTKNIRHSIDPMVFEVASESLLDTMLPSTKALMARISMLRALNRRARFALPWLPMRSAQEASAILGGLSGFGTSLERAGRTWDVKSQSAWVQTPCIASRLRHSREILFTSTKRFFLDSVMDATTTPTPLSHDEYELPREVRTVRVNRLKARRAMASDDSSIKKKHSVFSQLQREMRGWSVSALRRGFVAQGHGGQKRAFKVKLVGEGVNDYSGPYREVFTDAIQEITDLDPAGCSSLGVLDPTANNQADVGEGRDLFIFASSPNNDSSKLNILEKKDLVSSEEREMLNSFSSLTHKKSESSREIEEALLYLGKLVGTAIRHGIPCDLPLPLGSVWKRLAEENIGIGDIIKEIDILAYKSGENTDVLASSQRRLLNSFAEGLSSVLPVELLSMFTGEQLRDVVCGNADIDVELLHRVVEYEGYSESDEVIFFFWEVLREMTTTERKLFLQFVWARNRLPLKESDFDSPFKIQRDNKSVGDDGDYPLPSASTCFFTLSLPEYTDKETLKQKLLFAIENSTTMESDYQTNDVEINEGWRGL